MKARRHLDTLSSQDVRGEHFYQAIQNDTQHKNKEVSNKAKERMELELLSVTRMC